MVENTGASSFDELFLFHSETLETRDWTPHPMNPVVSDVRRARPAGHVFSHQGRLIRPAQDCSKRYGYGIRLNEILRMTESEYEEVERTSIEPLWDSRVIGMHTLSHAGNLTVVDGILRRRRFF